MHLSHAGNLCTVALHLGSSCYLTCAPRSESWLSCLCAAPAEFVNALCTEKWTVGGGQLVIEGGPELVGKKAALEQLGVQPDEMVDALGAKLLDVDLSP